MMQRPESHDRTQSTSRRHSIAPCAAVLFSSCFRLLNEFNAGM